MQFNDTNYQNSKNPTFLVAPGNRVDLLVMAPAASGRYRVLVQNEVDPTDLLSQNKTTLFSVSVEGAAADMQFISHAPSFPAFLTDIKPGEVKGTKTVTFASTPPFAAQHTIDGKKFNGAVGEVVLLNNVEEWKVYNRTFGAIPPTQGPPMISHPFHIHINPFQVVEVFNPAETITVNGQTVRRYVFDNSDLQPGQCYLDPKGNPDDYKPCGPSPAQSNLIWWDVFPIPSGILATDADNNPVKDAKGNQIQSARLVQAAQPLRRLLRLLRHSLPHPGARRPRHDDGGGGGADRFAVHARVDQFPLLPHVTETTVPVDALARFTHFGTTSPPPHGGCLVPIHLSPRPQPLSTLAPDATHRVVAIWTSAQVPTTL
ncbi:MAG: hypothetical protein ACR2M4_07025 [Actinomycetota bacterium]